MTIYNKRQKAIAEKIDTDTTLANWKDYKWQLKHVVRDIDNFEVLTGIKFGKKERQSFEKTIAKFPLSITPYYLSLIDTNEHKTDPILAQKKGD